jgi:hypothetical protein
MKFGKLLAGVVEVMPAEYRPVFLNYKLLKKQIFLEQRRACQCSIERQMQGLREVFRHPALQGRPCHLCSRPVYSLARDDQFKSTVHDNENDATPLSTSNTSLSHSRIYFNWSLIKSMLYSRIPCNTRFTPWTWAIWSPSSAVLFSPFNFFYKTSSPWL